VLRPLSPPLARFHFCGPDLPLFRFLVGVAFAFLFQGLDQPYGVLNTLRFSGPPCGKWQELSFGTEFLSAGRADYLPARLVLIFSGLFAPFDDSFPFYRPSAGCFSELAKISFFLTPFPSGTILLFRLPMVGFAGFCIVGEFKPLFIFPPPWPRCVQFPLFFGTLDRWWFLRFFLSLMVSLIQI